MVKSAEPIILGGGADRPSEERDLVTPAHTPFGGARFFESTINQGGNTL
jgi:hypothetical protein